MRSDRKNNRVMSSEGVERLSRGHERLSRPASAGKSVPRRAHRDSAISARRHLGKASTLVAKREKEKRNDLN
jgi:hypothetical protein